uniref:Hedgehog/Intein (Hint) domain-containing protein n=1 Tax=viral metagenome TaxID=1070528 RepID=A0A6C0H3I8_9ZZZZ
MSTVTQSGNQFNNLNFGGGLALSQSGTIIFFIIRTDSTLDGTSGTLLKSINSGYSFPAPTRAGNLLSAVCCGGGGTPMYFCQEGVNLYKSSSGSLTSINIVTSTALSPSSSLTTKDLCQIACNSTGTKLFATTRQGESNRIYYSDNSGVNWSAITDPLNPPNINNTGEPTYITSNAAGDKIYAGLTNIVVGTPSAPYWNWSTINMFGETGPFNSIATSSSGNFVMALKNLSLIIFYETYKETFDIQALGITDNVPFLKSIATFNNGNNFKLNYDYFYEEQSTAVATYTYTSSPPVIPCFREGSKILCLQDDKEVYVRIEDITKGDLVKTLKNGFLPVYMVGKKDIYHPALPQRDKDQLYKCSTIEYPEIFEDLFITGSHSILVEDFTDKEQRQKAIDVNGRIFITDKKYRLPACVDHRASVFDIEGTYTIYHLALESEDNYINYAIWANGLLVETCSKKYLENLFYSQE